MKNTVLLHHFYVDNSVFALQQCFLIGFVFSSHVVRFRALKTAPGFLLRISSQDLIYVFSKLHTFPSPSPR